MQHFIVSSLNLSPIVSEKFLLLVECCFCHGNPGLHFLCTSCIIYHATQIIEIFPILQFLPIIICIWDGYLEILITSLFSTCISIPQYFPISVSPSIMPSTTVSSLGSSTMKSIYFTVWITCPPILKSPNPTTESMVRHLLYKLIELVTSSNLV